MRVPVLFLPKDLADPDEKFGRGRKQYLDKGALKTASDLKNLFASGFSTRTQALSAPVEWIARYRTGFGFRVFFKDAGSILRQVGLSGDGVLGRSI